jgi:amino acid efflux transporter
VVSLLVSVVVAAVAGSAGSARAANWTPFAPHGWLAVGHAAATLMFSFVGWEAVAPLIARLADPSRQLARVITIALAVTTVLYLGLAITTIGVLGRDAATAVPLAALLHRALGTAGTAAAAMAAVVLTLGTTNAYINGAAAMARELTGARPTSRQSPWLLAAIAVSGLVLVTFYGFGLVGPAALVAIPTTLFLAVYLGCMAAAVRVLRGPARAAAVPAVAAVAVMLAFCGWAIAAPALVGAAVAAAALARPGARRGATGNVRPPA